MNSLDFMVNTDTMGYPIWTINDKNKSFEGMILVSFTEDIINDLVREIAIVKNRLVEAITNYIDGARATIETVTNVFDEKYRKMKRAKEYVEECEGYKRELTNFTINGVSSVSYVGYEYTLNESVRRLTLNHLEALQEKLSYIGIKSESVFEIQKEYEVLIKQFIQIVRGYF